MQQLLVLYVVTLPLLRFELFRFGSKSIVPSDVAFAALVVGASLVGTWRWPDRGLLLSAVLPVAAVVTVSIATDTALATAGPEIFRTAYSTTILIAFASLAIDRKRLQRAVKSWVIATCLVCIVGLLAFAAVMAGSLPQNPLARADSTNIGLLRVGSILGPNTLSVYLVVGFAMAAYLASTDHRKRWPAGAMVLMALTALLSFSRGLVGFALILSLLAFRRELAPTPLHKLRWAVGLATCGLSVVGVIATLWVHPSQLRPEQLSDSEAVRGTRPTAYRVLHTAGLRMLAAHPLVGVGPGNFPARVNEFTSPEERERSWPALDRERHWSPHSAWIGLAAEGGALLLLSWAWLFALLARRLVDTEAGPLLGDYARIALAGIWVNGLHVDLLHLKFIWASLGLALNERRYCGPR